MENKKIDLYLNTFFQNKTPKEIKNICSKIINFEPVKGLDDYAKELLALSIEKRMILAIEKSCQTIHRPSHWQNFKITAPFIYEKDNILNEYLDLLVREMQTSYPDDDVFKEIKQFYNSKIEIASKSFNNRLIKLPSGEKISINDIIVAVKNNIDNNKIIKREYNIKEKTGRLKNVAAIAGIMTFVGTSLALNQKEENNIIKDNNIEYENQDYEKTEVEINDIKYSSQKYDADEMVEEKINLEPIFVGYDNGCPIEYQRYILKMSNKYDVPFNVLMAIFDNESGGLFNTNGVISNTDDYGLFQINICNHDFIYEQLGYEPKDILNDPYKNIEAATLLVKQICNMYEEDLIQENYENIFGTYNGWKSWRNKEISRDYASNAVNKINTIYNKTTDELYVNVNEEENERKR